MSSVGSHGKAHPASPTAAPTLASKINFRGKYENFECEICMEEDETQKHIIYCKEINNKNENYIKLPEYEEIYNGNVNSQIMIAKRFMENVKIREKLKEA